MPVTGSNLSNIKSVSIQVTLNGLSFFNTKGNLINSEPIVCSDTEQIAMQIKNVRKLSPKLLLTIQTDNFIMIPQELYSAESEDLCFAAKSLPYNSECFAYKKIEFNKIAFVIAIENEIINTLQQFFEDINITHPLLETTKKSIQLNTLSFATTEKHCSISYAKGGRLLFSEFIPISSKLDTLYYIKKTIEKFSISKSIVCINGRDNHISQFISSQISNRIIHENS